MKELYHHQAYVIEEYAEAYQDHRLGRRDLLRRALMITGSVPLTASVLLALGCGDSGDEDAPVATATTAAAAPTSAAGTPAGTSATDPALEAADITWQGPASEMKGYLARPKTSGSYPAVVVIHENRGLLDHFKDVARRYAKEGFVALAVDLVSRVGGTSDDTTKNMTALRASPEDLLADLTSGVDYLKQQSFVKANAIGVSGFCFGGGQAFELAINNKDIKAAVPYYGTVSAASMEKFGNSNAAFLVMYGGTDTRVNAQIPDVTSRLQAANKQFEIKVWDGAGHAFFNDTGQAYNEATAKEAWPMTLAWFRKYLTG
ncbi:MAG: dienelactone hydrolase family protein [Dehalococcoidia bacterium]